MLTHNQTNQRYQFVSSDDKGALFLVLDTMTPTYLFNKQINQFLTEVK